MRLNTLKPGVGSKHPKRRVGRGIGSGLGTAIIGPHGTNQQLIVQDETGTLDTGEEKNLTITVPVGATSLKVTLVWTDPPGEGLQNDLDLIVSGAGGAERHGNQPANATAFDRTNNVEQVVWDHPTSGKVNIRVRAFRVAQFPQSYALVVRIF